MLAILSPAKDMKVLPSEAEGSPKVAVPEVILKAKMLMNELQLFSIDDLVKVMKVSEKLALQTAIRLQKWDVEHQTQNSAPSILSYTGEAYRGLNANSFDAGELEYAQEVLRILSGLYGVLKPLDLIQEYRLEMGTRHPFNGSKNLYAYWNQLITSAINKAVQQSPGDKVLINLASKEYASAINLMQLNCSIVTPSFYEEKEGKIKMPTVYAKKARGMFVRFVIQNKIEKLDDLKAFDSEGYFFDNMRSTSDNLVFIR